MLTTVLVVLLGAITVVNGHGHFLCPNSTETPVTIGHDPEPIPTCNAVDSRVYINITIGGVMYDPLQPFMLNAGNNTKPITTNVSVNFVMMVPPGVGDLTVTCNDTEYARIDTTMTNTEVPPSSISVRASDQSDSEATVTIGTIATTPPGCEGHCSYYNISYLPSDGSANDTEYERGPGTMLMYRLRNLMATTTYNVTVVCSESSSVYASVQFTTLTPMGNSGISVNPMMLLMVLSTLIGILMTARG